MVSGTAGAVSLLLCLLHSAKASLFNPHVLPEIGPYFEGWYIRAVDQHAGLGFALLFGQVVPEERGQALVPVYVGLLYDGQEPSALQVYEALPSVDDVNMTVRDGEPVTTNPRVEGPAWFHWSVQGVGYIDVKPQKTTVNVTVEGVHLEAVIGAPYPWNPQHTGPLGWLRYLPLMSLSWFVYSTHSQLISYSLSFAHKFSPRNSAPGRYEIMGHGGQVHMEKNHGQSFPDAWVWTQGMRADNVTFALAYGPVSFGLVTVPGHLGGYRNPNLDLYIDFRPDNSYMVVTRDECKADILVTIYTVNYKLLLHVFAYLRTFSQCIYGPRKNGFEEVAMETYKATAEVIVFQRNYFTYQEIDSQTIKHSALEFGGSFTCHNKCQPT